jgi:hypothetical protein
MKESNMAWNKLSTYKTVIGMTPAGANFVKYHDTKIVQWSGIGIVVDSGGWKTVTTKRKMNQAAIQFGLGFGVYQDKHEWFVIMPDGTIEPFFDGMYFELPVHSIAAE